jgi:hypothetical protein
MENETKKTPNPTPEWAKQERRGTCEEISRPRLGGLEK